MKIEKVERSKLSTIDLDNVGFGSTFTDHMLICHYKNGEWAEPEIKPFQTLNISPAAQVLHYGQAIFEGMKAYKDEEGEVFLFRPDKNFERFNKSAVRMAMPEVPQQIFIGGIKALVGMEKLWVPQGVGNALYIRPFMFASEAMITARPSQEYYFMIICSIVKSYYTKPLRVRFEEHYSRAAKGGVGGAKTSGNYAASFYPTLLAQQAGFDQVIWTDAATHTFVEEAGTMNVFFRIDDKLYTAPISDAILDGVTRHSLLTLAKDQGIAVEVKPIEVKTIIEAIEQKRLKEAFGCGTAVVVHHFSTLGYEEKSFDVQQLSDDKSYGYRLKKNLVDIQYNNAPDPFGWRVKVD